MKKILKKTLAYLFANKRITLTMYKGLFKGIKLNVSIKNQLGLVLNSVEPHLQKFLSDNLKNLSPKLIKIDVEGLVLIGIQKLVERCRPSIFIECTEKGREITWPILKALNYSCFVAQDDKKEIIDLDSYRHNDFIWIPNL